MYSPKFNLLEELTQHFNPETFDAFLRLASNKGYHSSQRDYNIHQKEDSQFSTVHKIGDIEFDNITRMVVVTALVNKELSNRSGKKNQYDLACRILKHEKYDAGLFAFYDKSGHFRLSLVQAQYKGIRRTFTTYRRYTYYVSPDLTNKTFLKQVSSADFSSKDTLLKAFSIEAVSQDFYDQFSPHFDALSACVQGTQDEKLKKDFALLFVIRVIFLGFVQKKDWLGGDKSFLQKYLSEYTSHNQQDLFYRNWLEPLFFEALNHAPGWNVYSDSPFSSQTRKALQMSPYLNGELFKRKSDLDDVGLSLPDQPIKEFWDFLFQYNFTIEENDLYDEELELNPEFLGLIFERLVNKEDGAVYTPRTEVDLMCRLALVKWLEQNNTTHIPVDDLYNFVFRNQGIGEEFAEFQKQGDFSPVQIRELIELLKKVTICDPAAGSGAFEVGMLHVLAELIENLFERSNTPIDLKNNKPADYELKRTIIASSLYGVEVKAWAVWINHLRLWLTLFVDMPGDYKNSMAPLLPSLTFKVCQGDSLVQRIGNHTFPIHEYGSVNASIKQRLTNLKQKKEDYFYNRNQDFQLIEQEELLIFQAIIDEQIYTRQQSLNQLLQPTYKQNAWLAPISDQQLELAQQEKLDQQRKVLEEEIKDLKVQKRLLHQDRPFIWNLEFSEIFIGQRSGFDIIIGNPPYVRQEEIADPLDKLQPAEYKKALQEMLLLDFSSYFAKDKTSSDQFRKGKKADGRSDLYTYFYIRSLNLLNTKGIHVFICSNSWLDVGYGTWLQEFLLKNIPMHFIIDNHARRSFSSSDVNTIITVFSAPQRSIDNLHMLRFVAFKKPFEEAVFAENLLEIHCAAKIIKNGFFRVFPITISALLEEGSKQEKDDFIGNQEYIGDKWGGKYLRAPDIYFTILEKGAGKFVRLGDVAEIKFGIKTGANDFFYLQPIGTGSTTGLLRVRNGTGWEGELEEEFLKPVIKSPRECRSICIDPSKLHFRIFMCPKSKAELKGTKALEYIEWGEQHEITIRQGKNTGKRVIGYHRISSVQGRRYWWNLGNREAVYLHFGYLINDVGRVYEGDIFTSDNFFDIKIKEKSSIPFNNSIFYLFENIIGRTNFGGGLIKIQSFELENMLIPKFDHHKSIDLINYEISSIFKECGIDPSLPIPIEQQLPNPKSELNEIDRIFFDEINLSELEKREIYRVLCQLVWSRLEKANNK
jgi:hypothetical protein